MLSWSYSMEKLQAINTLDRLVMLNLQYRFMHTGIWIYLLVCLPSMQIRSVEHHSIHLVSTIRYHTYIVSTKSLVLLLIIVRVHTSIHEWKDEYTLTADHRSIGKDQQSKNYKNRSITVKCCSVRRTQQLLLYQVASCWHWVLRILQANSFVMVNFTKVYKLNQSYFTI